jgi:hypothetical protein
MMASALRPHPNYDAVYETIQKAANVTTSLLDESSLMPSSTFKVFCMDNIQKKFESTQKKLPSSAATCNSNSNFISTIATHITGAFQTNAGLASLQQDALLCPSVLLQADRVRQKMGDADWAARVLTLQAGSALYHSHPKIANSYNWLFFY